MLENILPSTKDRVPESTSEKVNDRIRRETLGRINLLAANREGINDRLRELDREWDTERFLEMNASIAVLISIALAVAFSFYWLILTAAVPLFLLQHALQGWCPPIPIIRRLGFRTEHEIDQERTALKFLRGDFREICANPELVTRDLIE